MSVQAMSWVIDNSQAKGGTLLTLLMIANYTGADGTGAWPSIATLAKDTRMTERAVQMHIRELVDSGELVIEAGGGRGHANVYSIPAVKGEIFSPIELKGEKISVNKNAERVKNPAERVKPTSPHPLIEPLINHHRERDTRAKRKTTIPDDFEITDDMRKWASKKYPNLDVDEATEAWRDSMMAKGYEYINWEAGWRTGMNNHVKWSTQPTGRPRSKAAESAAFLSEVISATEERMNGRANSRANGDSGTLLRYLNPGKRSGS